MTDYSKLTPEAKEALVVKAKNIGYSTETLYGNCIQSTLHGIYRAFPDFGITEDMLRGCFGLAGGCGCCLDGTCGALLGAAWTISMSKGRPISDLGGNYEECHAMVREVVETFKNQYGGSILCRDVLAHNMGEAYDWKTPEGDQGYMEHFGTHHCATAVQFCTEIVARMIVDGTLKPIK